MPKDRKALGLVRTPLDACASRQSRLSETAHLRASLSHAGSVLACMRARTLLCPPC
jgi:hypothetical protein